MNKKLYFLLPMILTLCLTACSSDTAADGGSSASAGSSSGSISSVPAGSSPENSAFASAAGNTITVNSSEQVSVVPDIAQIVYSVRTQSSTASACQQENTASVSQVIDLLTGLDVAKGSIQTSDYYMSPVYDYSQNTARVTGYEAVTSLTVSDLPIDRLSEILSKSVDGGINTISSITYMASKYDESYQEALRAAVSAAYEKAQALALAAGCEVSKVVSITETSGYSEARYQDQALTNKQLTGAAMEDLLYENSSILPGEIQVEAGIIVEYALSADESQTP